MAFPLIFSLNQIMCSRTPLVPSVWPEPCVIPHVSTPSSSSALKTLILKLKHLPRASSQGEVSLLSFFSLSSSELKKFTSKLTYGIGIFLLTRVSKALITSEGRTFKGRSIINYKGCKAKGTRFYNAVYALSHILLQLITGHPQELIEDSKFVPLNAEDPRYGPPALLLLGFEVEELAKIQFLLKELDGEFLEIIFCTEDMINCSLWEAMHTQQPNLEKVKLATSLPRICFLSGLSGEEMMMFIDAFPETGLEPAVFAALVPNSADTPLRELVEEIMGDHEMLTAK